MPKISVIVPVYKAEKYIEACTAAILGQTFSDFELLLVDDGSPDESGAICDRLAETDARIKVIHKPNGGASSARNRGLDEATGEYIMFCDSDDRVKSDWCKDLIAAMEQGGADLCVCGYVGIRDGNVVRESIPAPAIGAYIDTDLWHLFELRLLNTPWNKIFRRSVIEENKLRFDEAMTDGEDQHFNLRYLQCSGQRIRILPKALYEYTEDNPQSVTSRFIPKMWEQKKKCYALLQQLVLTPDRPEIAGAFYDSLVDAVSRVLCNNMSAGNKIRTAEKIKMNTAILRDPVCVEATESCDCKTVSEWLVRLMKLKTYLPIYLLGKFKN